MESLSEKISCKEGRKEKKKNNRRARLVGVEILAQLKAILALSVSMFI